MLKFAEVLEDQRRYNETRILYQRLLSAKKMHLGFDNLETHITRCRVARQLSNEKGFDDAP